MKIRAFRDLQSYDPMWNNGSNISMQKCCSGKKDNTIFDTLTPDSTMICTFRSFPVQTLYLVLLVLPWWKRERCYEKVVKLVSRHINKGWESFLCTHPNSFCIIVLTQMFCGMAGEEKKNHIFTKTAAAAQTDAQQGMRASVAWRSEWFLNRFTFHLWPYGGQCWCQNFSTNN